MKILKLVLGAIFGLYAAAQAVFFVVMLQRGEHPSGLVASAAIFCVALAICLALFKSATARSEPPPEP